MGCLLDVQGSERKAKLESGNVDRGTTKLRITIDGCWERQMDVMESKSMRR